MSIEKCTASGTAQKTADARAGGKSGGADAGSTGGFTAILDSVADDAPVAGTGSGATDASGGANGGGLQANGTQSGASHPLPAAASGDADPAGLLAMNSQMASASAMAATAAAAAATAAAATASAASSDGQLARLGTVQDSALCATRTHALASGGPDASGLPGASARTGAVSHRAGGQSAGIAALDADARAQAGGAAADAGAGAAGGLVARGGAASHHPSTAADRSAQAGNDPAGIATGGAADGSGSNAANGGGQGGGGDPRDARLQALMQQIQTGLAGRNSDAAAPSAFGSSLAGVDKPASDRSNTKSTGSDAVYVQPTTTASASTSAGVAQPDAPPPIDAQVAHQIKYWISQDVQNAQLKLDGLGKDTVQVSISMTGNEANIVFRTDESATRSMLESATSHLKDLLGREGVVLAGVSVGTSAGGSGSNPDQRAPRQGVVSAVVSAPAASVARTPTAGTRALDLFV